MHCVYAVFALCIRCVCGVRTVDVQYTYHVSIGSLLCVIFVHQPAAHEPLLDIDRSK